MATKTKTGTTITFEYRLFDKYGRPKAIWKENRLGRFFREKFSLDIQRWPFGGPTWVMKNTAKKEL